MSTLFSQFSEKINQISPLETNFTEVLEAIALKPKTLYFHGKIPQNMLKKSKNSSQEKRPRTVAIVGSRHNTKYGEEIAYDLAYKLAKKGVVIVSGLAFGIDTIGHKGCLDAGGTTVAVLGTPIDRIYPTAHLSVAKQIIDQGGAIISEYAPRTPEYSDAPLAPGEYIDANGRRCQDHKASFLYRNRLISGLADIVVIVEAAERSGSLNTASHALAQGKDVFAVPGNITSPYSQGCNKLITEGAFPYTEPDDVLRILFPEDYIKNHKKARRANLIGNTDVETKILKAIFNGRRSGEEIMEEAKLPPEVFNQSITLLEINGRIRSLGLNQWSLS